MSSPFVILDSAVVPAATIDEANAALAGGSWGFPTERQLKAEAEAAEAIAASLALRRFDILKPPPPPVPLFYLASSVIATAENIMVVQAKMKSGKSAAIGAMMAASMGEEGDFLGFAAANPKGWAVIHFDTEQSKSDHFALIVRTLRRAGHAAPPSWFYSYTVKGAGKAEMKRMIIAAMELAQKECGEFIASSSTGWRIFAWTSTIQGRPIHWWRKSRVGRSSTRPSWSA